MKIRTKHTSLFISLCALMACSENDVIQPEVTPNAEKTPISLNIGGVDAPVTRNVVTDNPYSPRNFNATTTINFVMKSDKADGTASQYCVTRGVVTIPKPSTSTNDVTFNDTYARYWDDTYARDAKVSIWAYTSEGTNWADFKVGGKTTISNWDNTQIDPIIDEWKVSANATYYIETELKNQDLIYSNNVVDYSSDTNVPETSRKDNRLKYTPNNAAATSGVFDKANLKFYHAMSKITVKLIAGDGYESSSFDVSDKMTLSGTQNEYIKLNKMNSIGKFDIAKGEFVSISEKTQQIQTTVRSRQGKNWQFQALIIPALKTSADSYNTDASVAKEDANDNIFEFTIDNNKYYVTSANLFKALLSKDGTTLKGTSGSQYIPYEAGKNYIFTFNIGKSKVNSITAQIAEWKDVTADEFAPSNAYVNVSVKTSEGDKITGSTPGFSLYRAAGATYTGPFTAAGYNAYADYTWEKGYETTPATLTETSSGVYSTNWYWPDNNTFYHFRTLTPIGQTLEGNDANTYVAIHGGVIKEGSVTAIDYLWGAPFITTAPTPDLYSFTSGYCNNETKAYGQLYKAIGATEDNITLIQHHMTSQVFVKLETTTGSDKVDLTDATVELTNVAKAANLLLGNGLITSYSDFGTINMTYDHHDAVADPATPAYDYSYGVLPQLLTNNTSKTVGITITAKDGNKYIIDDIQIAKFTGTDNPITKWEPGKKYYYTFRLIKTGIDKITATIVKWETVTADPDDVYIK